jgi:hypothetical protein
MEAITKSLFSVEENLARLVGRLTVRLRLERSCTGNRTSSSVYCPLNEAATFRFAWSRAFSMAGQPWLSGNLWSAQKTQLQYGHVKARSSFPQSEQFTILDTP